MRLKHWYIGIKFKDGAYLVISKHPITDCYAPLKLSQLTANAAVRRYTRNHLNTALYLLEDGINTPTDFIDPNPWNHYNPRKHKQHFRPYLQQTKSGKIPVVNLDTR